MIQTKSDRSELIAAARAVVGEFKLREEGLAAGGVGAAIRTSQGNIYTGICLDLSCGLGFCAEVAAVAKMLEQRETRIEAVVAVGGETIMPPCGRCRETIAQVDAHNLDCKVILAPDREVTLRELLPEYWLA
ncbi:MAG: hypothetical protein J0I77_21905 [Rudaea sp.]|uniref:cytidine deaminase family protein n=1 Tax=unclassified Rudaea TaxID=2627037 RepID=UPI0010F81F0E|nr:MULTISPECIES: cytidine deaminase [unclassified Rudaea]MBN8888382.1 hypothetical protein [Rudaea sp.]MBR0347395.1 hypothetical protein [Rudaea sp.]